MSEGFGFTRKITWFKGDSRTSELSDFLDSLPQAALLTDTQNWVIDHVNPAFLSAFGFSQSELKGTRAQNLFADWSEDSSDRLSPDNNEMKRLILRDQSQIKIKLHVAQIVNNPKYAILILEPSETATTATDHGTLSSFWKIFQELIVLTDLPDLQDALMKVLDVAAELSGAEILTVYRLCAGSPEIQRLASFGEESVLPELLSMQDLLSLNQPQLWETGKYPVCGLHRSVRAFGIRYLASAPIGQNTAIVGLILIAGKRGQPSSIILDLAQLLATVLESIFQNHIQHSNTNKQLSDWALQTNRLSTIADRVQEGVVQLTPDLAIRSLNPQMEQSLGYFSREVAGQPIEKILIGTDQILPALYLAQKGDPVFQLKDISLFRRNGESFQAEVRIFPVLNGGQIDEILIFIQDLSELEKIRSRSVELENRALLGELMAVFAHEVRNPINNISTNLQLMAVNLKPDDPVQAPISRMQQDCDRLEDLIKSVLAFSKPQEYTMEQLDLGLLLQRLLDRLRPRISAQKIQTDLQVEPGCPLVSGNARALEQVFYNLMNNAVQAMGENGGLLSLKVQAVPSEEGIPMVEIFVADTGPGIPKEVQDRVFQPFFTTKQSGTGLGLAISKRILHAHKGNIRLSSFPGGTIFHILLPAVRPPEKE